MKRITEKKVILEFEQLEADAILDALKETELLINENREKPLEYPTILVELMENLIS